MAKTQKTIPVTLGGQLKIDCTVVEIGFTQFCINRALTREQRQAAADTFKAKANYVSGGKKLIDTKTPEYLALSNLRTRITEYWKSVTLPYVKAAKRLIRRDRIPQFVEQMETFAKEMAVLAAAFQDRWDEIRAQAQQDLQELWDPNNYPENVADRYSVAWEFHEEDPPSYLKEIAPDVYERQCQAIAARFEQAVEIAESEFTAEFAEMVTHLAERLEVGDDGKPKTFRDSAVDNLKEFFDRYRNLSIRSNAELDRLIDEVNELVEGKPTKELRTNAGLRTQVRESLQAVAQQLEPMMTERRAKRGFFFDDATADAA